MLTKKCFYNIDIDFAVKMLEDATGCHSFLNSEIELYRNIVAGFEKEYSKISENILLQFFECEFYVDSTKKSKYTMVWDVEKAKEIIKRDEVILQDYSINRYINNFDATEINEAKLMMSKNSTTPVIFGKYSPCQSDVLIDGNHRFRNAIESASVTLPAYVLSIKQTLECMLNETFRTLYKVHHNMIVITQKMLNQISHIKYSNEEKENSLYQLRQSKISCLISAIKMFFVSNI